YEEDLKKAKFEDFFGEAIRLITKHNYSINKYVKCDYYNLVIYLGTNLPDEFYPMLDFVINNKYRFKFKKIYFM
nr:hypothetical protein [Mycoplasmoidaceae bacterium]